MPKPLRILLVEDAEDDGLLLMRELRRGGYDPVYRRVETPDAMRAALEQQSWDIVISDYILPKFSGMAALTLLKESELDLPFIIVSGNIGEDIAVNAMLAGAHDYIIKGNLARLIPAVQRELRDAEMRRERKSAEDQLRETRQRLFETLETIREGFFLLDRDWRFTYVNAEAAKLWKKSREELTGAILWDVVPGAVGSLFDEQYRRAVRDRVPVRFESISPLLGIWVEVRAYPSADGLAVYFHDITERKQAEEKISRLNRLYSVLSKVNEAIVRVHDPEELYKQVCRITVEDGAFKLAWVGLIDADTRKVRPVADFGDASGYLQEINIYAADVPEGKGPSGRAGFEGAPVICADFEHDEVMLPWRAQALRHGIRSSSAFPLRSGASITGVFTIYSDKPQFFTEEEVGLLSSLAADISFAIASLANEKKRAAAEEALHKSLTEARDLYNNAPCGYHSLDNDGAFVLINDTELKWLGYRREEVLGKLKFTDLLAPESARKFRESFPLFKERGWTSDADYDMLRRDGSMLPVLLSATAIRDNSGVYVMSRSTVYDMTEKREGESKIRVTNALLSLYAQKFSRHEYLQAAVGVLREWSGCHRIGVRIADRRMNLPFEASMGYNETFLDAERSLSLENDNCICTRVVRQKPEPRDLQAMTAYGSFYSNDTTRFIDSLTEEEKKSYLRHCMQSGAGSLAVIPIRYRDSVLGSIHAADKQEDLVPLVKVEFLEYLAHIIGEAIFRFGIEEDLHRNFEALRDSELRYRNLVDDVRDIIFTLTPDGVIRSLNPAFEALGGPPREEAIGTHFSAWIHPDDMPLAKRFLEDVLNGKPLPLFELRGRTRAGEYLHLEFKISSMQQERGMILGIARDVTERKQAEEALRLASAYNRSLIEASLDPLVTIGADGTITDVNAATEAATGRRREELLGTDFSEYFAEPAKARSVYLQVFREGSARDYALDILHRDGRTTPVLYNASLYRDDSGKVIGIFAAARDVTELKEAELRNTVTSNLLELFTRSFSRKEYLDAAVEIIRSWCRCRSVGMRLSDRDGNIPYASCTGYDAAFIESENMIALNSDRCACSRVVLGALDPLDSSAMTPSGSLYYHDAVAFMDNLTGEEKKIFRGVCQRAGFRSIAVIPIRYRDKVLGAVHLADDQEGRFPLAAVEFLERLAYIIGEAMFRYGVEEEQRRLASAVESSADAVVMTDAKGVIRYVNRAFESITGYGKDEVMHGSLHILDSGRQREDFFRRLRETLDKNDVWRGLLINKKKDGTLYYEDCTLSPVRDAAGEIINYVSIKRDVTEKLRLESIAESVNTMNNIGYVFSGVRHEIGNPINSAKMSLNVLQHKLDNASKEVVKDYVDRALGEIGRVEHLLKNLRNFNLYETPELESLGLTAFFEKFFKLVTSDFEQKGITIRYEVAPDADRVVADTRALQQVLLNVMTNASDALADRPSPAITVSAVKKSGRIVIQVADNGAGMTEKQQQDLFKPFYTSKTGGTGLGLVIVKKMLTKMNGSIEITSRHGAGTTVTIYLPEGNDGAAR